MEWTVWMIVVVIAFGAAAYVWSVSDEWGDD